MFNLDIRLSKICEIIPPCHTLADIGSDHGYLPVYLLKHGKISHAIITDMNKGPLANAEKNALKYNLSDKCEFLLGDGLTPLSDKSFDAVSICGMGGELIAQILKDNESIARKKKLILQPMNNSAYLRKYLYKNGYKIFAEAIVKDEYHFYQMFGAEYCESKFDEANFDTADYEFAPSLIEKKDPIMLEYLLYKEDVRTKIYNNIKENSSDNTDLIIESEKILNQIKERIKRYDS